MSNRHHRVLMPVTEPELAAHNRAERQRVRVELARMNADAVEDLGEPGIAYRVPHRHDPELNYYAQRRPYVAHWKQPFWKRRTAMRKAKVYAELALR